MTREGKQARIDLVCAWCGLPGVGEVLLQEAIYEKGEGGLPGQLLKQAQKVPACDEHLTITENQPAPIGSFRQRKAKGVEQMEMFADGKKGNAIYGNEAA